jgi:hypothetical protein
MFRGDDLTSTFCIARLAETVFQEMEVRHAQGVEHSRQVRARGTQRSDTCELISFSPDGRYVIGVSDEWLPVWDSAGRIRTMG